MTLGVMEPEIEEEATAPAPISRVKPLTQAEITTAVAHEIQQSFGGLGSKIEQQQREALRRYDGKPMGTEEPGLSQVHSLDVLETIQWAMPSLMRMFTSGSKIVRFTPNPTQDPQETARREQNAKDATDYVNYLFRTSLDGYKLIYDWMFTALLEKNGVVKTWWDERRYPQIMRYTGLSEDEALNILDDEDTDPISKEAYTEEIGGQTLPVFDLVVRKWTVKRSVKAIAIPPEEFLISRRAVDLNDDTHYSSHTKLMTISELVSMGFDLAMLEQLPANDVPDHHLLRIERHAQEESAPVETTRKIDVASREIWVTESYIHLDEDGDGYAELRRILTVGKGSLAILADEEVSMNPFASICPVPTAHKFYGKSLADLVIDIQRIRTTLLRQMMDYIYLSVKPRYKVVSGQVDYEDLMTVVPGGLVEVDNMEAIAPLEMAQMPREAGELFRLMEDIRGSRTGVVAHGTEIDSSAINTTASGMAQLMGEKAQKLELIGRIFAQTGMRTFFTQVLRLVCENATKKEQFSVNGRWITVDPASWDSDMNVDIVLGLGAGAAVERVANIEKIMAVQKQHVEGGAMGMTITIKELYSVAIELVDASGFSNPDVWFQNPEGVEPPPPPPDPKIEALRLESLKAQQDYEIETGKIEVENEKQAHLTAYRAEDLRQKRDLEVMRIDAQTTVSLGQQEATIRAAQISADARNDSGGGDEPIEEGEEA